MDYRKPADHDGQTGLGEVTASWQPEMLTGLGVATAQVLGQEVRD
jgi:hypothetical protein